MSSVCLLERTTLLMFLMCNSIISSTANEVFFSKRFFFAIENMYLTFWDRTVGNSWNSNSTIKGFKHDFAGMASENYACQIRQNNSPNWLRSRIIKMLLKQTRRKQTYVCRISQYFPELRSSAKQQNNSAAICAGRKKWRVLGEVRTPWRLSKTQHGVLERRGQSWDRSWQKAKQKKNSENDDWLVR